MSKIETSALATHDDGSFIRTALVAETDKGPSVAIIDIDGNRLALINIFYYESGKLIVDVIDVDQNYQKRTAITFDNGQQSRLEGNGTVFSIDFRKA